MTTYHKFEEMNHFIFFPISADSKKIQDAATGRIFQCQEIQQGNPIPTESVEALLLVCICSTTVVLGTAKVFQPPPG